LQVHGAERLHRTELSESSHLLDCINSCTRGHNEWNRICSTKKHAILHSFVLSVGSTAHAYELGNVSQIFTQGGQSIPNCLTRELDARLNWMHD
jgi:hypothetical protein